MGTVGGLLGYLGVLAMLMIGGFVGAAALLSPSVDGVKKAAAYGAPTRVRDRPQPRVETAVTPTQRIGPAIVHVGPEPPSQSALAKLRLKASDQELRQSRTAQRRAKPRAPAAAPVDAGRTAALGYAPVEAGQSSPIPVRDENLF